MQWTHFFRNIVKRYSVVIEGWPEKIPFVNLSTASSSLIDLEMLLRKWRSGLISWKRITPEQLEDMEKDRDKDLESGTIVENRRRVRSDKGKKRCRDSDDSAQRRKKMYKSAETVSSDSEEDATPNTNRAKSVPPPIPSRHETMVSSLVPNALEPLNSNLPSTPSLVTDAPQSIPVDDNIHPMLPPAPLLTPNTEFMSPFLFSNHEFPEGFNDFLVQFNPSMPMPPYTGDSPSSGVDYSSVF